MAKGIDMRQSQSDSHRQYNPRSKQIDLLAVYRTLYIAYVRKNPNDVDERLVDKTSPTTMEHCIDPITDFTEPVKR